LYPFSSPSLIGLDINPHGLWLMQLRKAGNRFQVELAANERLPEAVFVDGKIMEWELIRQVVSQLVNKMGLTGMAAAIHIPAREVHMQKIQIPRGMSDYAIEEEIKMQIKRDFPGLSHSLFIDFSVEKLQQSPYLQVSFAAAREEYISQYVNCIHSSGLKVKVVDVDVYALERGQAINSFSSQHIKPENFPDFFMACGLAMREVPKW